MKILALNSGSSSQKSCLYEIGNSLTEHPPNPVWEAKIEWNNGEADIHIKTSAGKTFQGQVNIASRREALEHRFAHCGRARFRLSRTAPKSTSWGMASWRHFQGTGGDSEMAQIGTRYTLVIEPTIEKSSEILAYGTGRRGGLLAPGYILDSTSS